MSPSGASASVAEAPASSTTDVPAHRLAAWIRDGTLSAVEALEASLDRIAAVNPLLNAVVSLDVEGARRAARQADADLRDGREVGPLHGVPMTLKDGHDVAGMRTTVGDPQFDRIAAEDGTVAARLRAAGAVLIVHTNVPPFLADYQTVNDVFGRTSNPWDPGRTPGGSSGGAAAAVAAGLTPLEIGSDLTGSLRLPAAFCGVYGLKTTEHRVPLTGFFRPPEGTPRSVRIMSVLGPIGRDLDDLRLALEVIAGPDGRDGDVPPVPVDPHRPVDIGALRVAVAETLPGATPSAAMRSVVAGVAARLSDAGARVDDAVPGLDWTAAHGLFMRLLGVVTDTFVPGAALDEEQRSVAHYLALLDRRDAVIATWERYFERVDVLLLPASLTTAFPHVEPYGSIDIDGRQTSYLEQGALLTFANLAGVPSLTVPAGQDAHGLPMGVQLVGPRWSEGRLLAIAGALEASGVVPGFAKPGPERLG